MQIEMFPEKELPLAMDVTIQTGQIGPIRFATTPPSYPHLCQTLAALTTTKGRRDGEIVP